MFDIWRDHNPDIQQFTWRTSKISFETTVRVLTDFASTSGLNINYEKSQVIWIGSKIYCKDVYLPHLKLDWNPKVFKILGIKFTTNIKEISEINFENKLFEIKKNY